MRKLKSTKKVKYNIFSGLGRTLLLNFLFIALIPILIISWYSYKNVLNCFKFETEITLKTVAESKIKDIKSYYKKIIHDLTIQTSIDSNINILKELETGFQTSGISIKKFTESKRWHDIVNKNNSNIKRFYINNNYSDIFFINNDGDILYSLKDGKNIGVNIFNGELKNTAFSNSVKKSTIKGDFVISDYENYNDRIYGFIVKPVFDNNKYQTGIIAFQFSIDQVNKIMTTDLVPEKRYYTYLVGADATLRSTLLFDREKKLVKYKIISELTKRILNNNNEINFGKIIKYKGFKNKSFIGILKKIKIENIEYYIISEIEENEAFLTVYELKKKMFSIISMTLLFVIVLSLILVKKIIWPIVYLALGVKRVEKGDYSGLVGVNLKNEIGELAKSFNEMIAFLKSTTEENALQDWFTTGKIELNDIISGIYNPVELADKIIEFLDMYLNSDQSALYILENKINLRLLGTYKYSKDKILSYEFGQGLIGQAAQDKKPIIFKRISENNSSEKKDVPDNIIIYPFIKSGEVIGVLEFIISSNFLENTLKFLSNISEDIAVAFKNIISHTLVQDLLKKSHNQTLKVEKQQQELKKININLKKKTEALEKSEEKSKLQKEELRNINRFLSLQSEKFEKQKKEIEKKNIDLEKTKKELELKAKDLETSGKYKSEFLANMSHEFRTPLNSIILLSNHLSLNKGGFLNEKQLECVETINTSGNELLHLINDVLDISKVEAGHMNIEYEKTAVKDIIISLERNFQPLAEEKNLAFKIKFSDDIPEFISTDVQKLSQILKNLLSNAFKFTDKGSVILEISTSQENSKVEIIEFKVIDTGLGISQENKKIVFEAFQQADGSTSRYYGGTGLGLSISKEYAKLFGGDILLESEEGKGSTFILYIPVVLPEPVLHKKNNKNLINNKKEEKNILKKFYNEEFVFKGKKILVVDDDMRNVFAIINTLEDKKMTTIVAKDGAECLKLLEKNPDTDLVLIDIMMPVMDGFEAMKKIRKMKSEISKVPVIAVTSKAMKDDKISCIKAGANAYLAKPFDIEKLLSIMRLWVEKQE